jgi:hypothetical protein
MGMEIFLMIFIGMGCILLMLLVFWLINILKYKIYFTRHLFSPIKAAPPFKKFSVNNPYHVPGQYRKAQLHLHTSNSIDVTKKEPVSQTIKKYQKAGYSFVVITDHDTVTSFSGLNDSGFLVMPGIEKTVPFSFWPFGKHLIKIGGKNGLLMPAHPNWQGNLGTGSWSINALAKLKDLCLIEINNHHSDAQADRQLWHRILAKRSFQNPVWGVAVDDSDNGEVMDRGWIMIKTEEITVTSFLKALQQGNFYATTGPTAAFEADGHIIKVNTESENHISYINNQNKNVAVQKGSGSYQFTGNEGFIRVEIIAPSGKTAWSQPFFVVPENGL